MAAASLLPLPSFLAAGEFVPQYDGGQNFRNQP